MSQLPRCGPTAYIVRVLLYRLLIAGHPPYRLKTCRPEEIAQAVCNQQPGKPSTAARRDEAGSATHGDSGKLRRRLRGDLDNIVLMALRKEPERRYAYPGIIILRTSADT